MRGMAGAAARQGSPQRTGVGSLEQGLVELVGRQHVCVEPDGAAFRLAKLASVHLEQQREGEAKHGVGCAAARAAAVAVAAAAAGHGAGACHAVAAGGGRGGALLVVVLGQAHHAAHEVCACKDVAPLIAAAHLHPHAVLPPHVHKVVALCRWKGRIGRMVGVAGRGVTRAGTHQARASVQPAAPHMHACPQDIVNRPNCPNCRP